MKDFQQRLAEAPILVVDDVEANVILLENLLRQRGYQNVRTTSDPLQVKPLHAEVDFALILLDMQMPKLDGLGVLGQLRQQADTSPLPVLVITAQTDSEVRLRALELGARDYVTKPFVVAELSQRIRNLLEVELAYRDRMAYANVLEEEVRQRTREIEATQNEILRRLALAGEYRDNETGNHVMRVSHSSRALAIAFGLDERTAELILHASPMHDVGKIGVPDYILLYPGRLQGEELKRMRSHVEIGGRILDGHDAPVMRMAHRIAMAHHERWDGAGYPKGLAGEDIPVEARIVAICDVFDALTSPRPYKAAWTIDDAANYLREQSGRHFDPRLVGCFLDILPDVIAIRDSYTDLPEPELPIDDRIDVQR
jgi:putative two-component system response regulator